MTAPERLLELEVEAHLLVDELTTLRNETRSYRTAGVALEQAGEQLSRLASDLASLAARLDHVIQTMRGVGMTQLLEEHEVTRSQILQLRGEIEARTADLGSRLEEDREVSRSQLQQLRGELSEALATMASRAEGVHNEQRAAISLVAERVDATAHASKANRVILLGVLTGVIIAIALQLF